MTSKPDRGRSWWRIALGPALFIAVEIFFAAQLDLSPEQAVKYPRASPELVKHVLAATLWIAAWWFTEAIPIAATSLLPLVLWPLLGIAKPAEVSALYGDEVIFLFLGGFLLALGMERTGLHRRLAMRVLRIFGQQPRRLVLGFMVATALLSMWISNTATTVMMLPVALAVLATRNSSADGLADERQTDERSVDEPFAIAVLLGIAYAANVGGLGTPVGSPPNIAFQKIFESLAGERVTFLEWMLYGVPVVLVLIPTLWWLLTRNLPRSESTQIEIPRFGPMSSGERFVLWVFLCTVALWITRGDFGALKGWGARLQQLGDGSGPVILDSTVAIAAALALFLVPAGRGAGPILDWSVAPRLPWGVLLLMGAGFVISNGFEVSGLTIWLGSNLAGIGTLAAPPWMLFALVLGSVIVVSLLITEFASNTASANILLPVIYGLAIALGAATFSPELLMVACALTCSCGFAVPAGTPPNALVFATERISIARFIRIGLFADLLAVFAIALMIQLRR